MGRAEVAGNKQDCGSLGPGLPKPGLELEVEPKFSGSAGRSEQHYYLKTATGLDWITL